MKLTTSGYFKTIHIVCLFYAEADVSIQLAHQTVTNVTGSYVFTFLTCEWTVVYDKLHCNRRLRDFLEWDCLRILR